MSSKNKKIFDTIETLIGVETTFTGNISVTNSLRIDGKVIGNITNAGSIIVGDKAEVKGNINTNYIVIDGVVEGNIIANDGIELLSKAKVIGDIKTTILSINEGAIFKGKSLMFEKEEDSSDSDIIEK